MTRWMSNATAPPCGERSRCGDTRSYIVPPYRLQRSRLLPGWRRRDSGRRPEPSFPYHGRSQATTAPPRGGGMDVGPRERCSLRACCGSSGGWWSGLLGRWVVRLPVVTPLSATSLPTPLGLHPMASPWDEGREGKGISSLATVAAVRLLRGLTLLCASPALVVEGRLDSSVEPKAPTGTYRP